MFCPESLGGFYSFLSFLFCSFNFSVLQDLSVLSISYCIVNWILIKKKKQSQSWEDSDFLCSTWGLMLSWVSIFLLWKELQYCYETLHDCRQPLFYRVEFSRHLREAGRLLPSRKDQQHFFKWLVRKGCAIELALMLRCAGEFGVGISSLGLAKLSSQHWYFHSFPQQVKVPQ